MTKKIKLYKRKTHKWKGGEPKYVPHAENLKKYLTINEPYAEMIVKLDYNLNLNTKALEGCDGNCNNSKNKFGCFAYLDYMITNLQTRPAIRGSIFPNGPPTVAGKIRIQTLQDINLKLKEIRTNYTELCTLLNIKNGTLPEPLKEPLEPLETEIVFHFILGCVESLQNEFESIQTVIQETKATFTEFTDYLNFKIERFRTQLAELKRIENTQHKQIDGIVIYPVKIKDNLMFYELWKRTKNTPEQLEHNDIVKVMDEPASSQRTVSSSSKPISKPELTKNK